MRVYYFTKKTHALSNLENSRLKISRLDELNDPFELMGLALKSKAARRQFAGFKRQMNDSYGLLCFSRKWHSPVMWAHYGDRHRGICLGVDVPFKLLRKVDYSADMFNIALRESDSGQDLNEDSMQKLLFTKFEDWAYEDEYRIYARLEKLDTASNLYFRDFDNDIVLKEVIVGPMCDTTYHDVRSKLNASTRVKIIKARLAFTSYKVVLNKKPGGSWL